MFKGWKIGERFVSVSAFNLLGYFVTVGAQRKYREDVSFYGSWCHTN